MRSNVGRQARRLFAAGDVELVFADGQAAADWFAAYLDLEARSWKGGTSSAVGRNPKRQAFYAEIANGGAGFAPSFVGVVLDGVLIAGLIVAADAAPWAHADGAWCMEMAFDEAHAELGPGNLLLLLAVGEALADGDRYLNFLQNFAYFKHRWLADSIEMVNVELCRRLGPYYVKGRLGDVRRWFLTRRGRTEEIYGASKGHPDRIAPAVTDAEQSRALVAAARRSGSPGLRILDRCGAEDYLPFSVQ